MKILHIWDICENSKYLTEKLLEKGHKSLVITRKTYARKRLLNYYLKVIFHLLTFRADIIHINAWRKGILFAKIFSPKSKILMHYHGSDIRWKKMPKWSKCVNINCFSTQDIFDECDIEGHHKLLPVLVPECFTYTGGRVMGTTLELDPYKRNVPYELMPFMLSQFEFYRDRKRRDNITSAKVLSKTGLEALRCGTKVIVDTGEIIEDFPMAKPNDYYSIYNFMVS